MQRKVSLIKWSNSFPGIISIVFADHPALVLLYDSVNLSQPGKFYELDPNREHGSIRIFSDSVICMDWGYNSCSNYLAIALNNGHFSVNLCEKDIFRTTIYSHDYVSRFQKWICMKWRKTQNHIAVGYLKDGKYCIDVLNVDNQSVVIPTIMSNQHTLRSLHWVDRKQSHSNETITRTTNYMGLGLKTNNSQDFLLIGYENFIQVVSIQSSSYQNVYSVTIPYTSISTIFSQVAIVNNSSMLINTPFVSTSSTDSNDFRIKPILLNTQMHEMISANQSSDSCNTFIFEVEDNGKLSQVASFMNDFSQVTSIRWFSKQELFISDLQKFSILNVQNNSSVAYSFPTQMPILQCGVNNLEHPIMTRIITFMDNNKSMYWDFVIPIHYNSMSFRNNNMICIATNPKQLTWSNIEDEKEEDVFDLMVKRARENYGENIQTNISIFEKHVLTNPTVNNNLDLYLFWKALSLLNQLDEDNFPMILSNQNLEKENIEFTKFQSWAANGITSMLNQHFRREDSVEKCGWIRVYVSEKRERLLKKIIESCNTFLDNHQPDAFHRILLLVVQCNFDGAIRTIQNLIHSFTSDVPSVTIERLLSLSNILVSVSSYVSEGAKPLIIQSINLQLSYFTKEFSPILFKILQFLLMYLRSDNMTSPRGNNSQDAYVLEYLKNTSTDQVVAVDDLIVILRYLSSPYLNDYLHQIENQMIQRGCLFGLLFIGIESPHVQTLIQNYINRTSDVQTISILSLSMKEVYNCSLNYIKYYYDLLERAELFNLRCTLESRIYDLYKHQLSDFEEHSERYVPGVIVCSNCNTKLIPLNTNTHEWKTHHTATPICVTCQKPLFTCSLCSLPVWQDTADWLVWCYACHHGGHYSHITNWFKSHSECPVNGCNCHCREILCVC